MARRTYTRDSRGRFASTGSANLTTTLRGAPKRLRYEIAYHGTSIEAAAAIKRGGYRESRDGNIGPGVYLTTRRKEARKYAAIAENPGVAARPGAVLRHRLLKGRHQGATVDAGPGRWEAAYGAAQEAKARGQMVRGSGGMAGVLLLSKAQADRTLDRSTGKIRARRRR